MKALKSDAVVLAGVWSLAAAVLSLFAVSIAIHGGWLAGRFQWNAPVFALIGGIFVLVTLLLHAIGLRIRARGGSPLVALAAPMSVRLLVTFLLLVGLLAFEVMGQNEAVASVLYWYAALTCLEIAANVRAVKAMGRPSSAGYDTVVRGV